MTRDILEFIFEPFMPHRVNLKQALEHLIEEREEGLK